MPVSVLDYGYDEKGKLDKTQVYSIHTDHLGTPKAISDKDKISYGKQRWMSLEKQSPLIVKMVLSLT